MANKKTVDEKTLEQVFSELEAVIGKMESEDSLEESFKLYHQGMDMLKLCSEKIDKVEKQMLLLDENGETHEFESTF
jgi:exodeoxyribonuclease VII small subunit